MALCYHAEDMTALWIDLHDACVIWMTAIIWLVQVRIYPHFRSVSEPEFTMFHARHCRRITFLVWPMFGELFLCGGILLQVGPRPGWLIQLSGILIIFAATAFLSVPEHNRLGLGKDSNSIERLIRTNWVRTAMWTGLLLEVVTRRT